MSLVDSFKGKLSDFRNTIANPFEEQISTSFEAPDFPEGFKIEEILANGRTGDKIALVGNWMPQIPFVFGGKQRIKKEYYSGYSEPTMQVFGPEEDDITINGLFKAKKFRDPELQNVSTEIQQMIDGIRIRGNLVRISMGEFERYGLIQSTKFDFERLSRIGYSIGFSIIGFNAPKNAIFLQRKKEVPFDINKELVARALEFQLTVDRIPDSVGRSIADQINALTSEVSNAITAVTGFVDEIFSTIQDIKSAINRIKGLIKFAQKKLRSYKRQLGAINSFDPNVSLGSRYASAGFIAAGIAAASSLSDFLQRLREQFSGLVNTFPLARHFVITGDTLQKISVKFYGESGNWKEIYDYNDLSTTELVTGTLLEIPRL